jgi:ankyrin repeat protein
MMAVCYDVPEALVVQMLKHESCSIRLQNNQGQTALMLASNASIRKRLVCELLRTAPNEQEVQILTTKHPDYVASYCFELSRRMQERQTVSDAFKAGLSLPSSMVLTYL